MAPLRIALAIDQPRREAALLALFEGAEPPFRVAGRPCAVTQLCASVAELRSAVAGDSADVVIASATLNAIPFPALRALAGAGRPLVVLALDPADVRWDGFPTPVLDADADPATLAEALATAVRGTTWRTRRERPRPADHGPAPVAPILPTALPSGVLAVTGAYAGEGKTTLATALAFALGASASTVLLDGDTRSSGVEFHLGADPSRNLCLIAQRDLATPAAWDAALARELQPMGSPSRGLVLCGVAKPSLRPLLSPAYVERLMAALRERYRYIVLDTSGAGWAADDPEIDRLLLRLADRLLVVLRPDTQGVARARRVLRDWPRTERVTLVLNQAGLPGQDARAEIELTLGAPVATVLPADPRGVAAARVRHRPVVCQPGCRLAAPLLELAGRITGGAPIALPADPDPVAERRWWRRLPLPAAGLLR